MSALLLPGRLHRVWAAAVLAVLATAVLAGCGPTGSVGTASSAATSAAAGAMPGAGGAAASPSSTAVCQKVRFALHAGLAAGAAHRYLWKPYRAGTFAAGARGRRTALVKAALAGAFTVHELKIALRDVQGCPSTQALVAAVRAELSGATSVATQVKAGTVNPGSLAALDGAVSSVQTRAKADGITVTETDPSPAQLAGASTGA